MRKVVFATALALCVAQSFATPRLPFTRGTNCNGLDIRPYSTSRRYDTYIYGLDSTYRDIKARGFDSVRFSVDLTKYYDSSADALRTSGSYNIGIIDGFIRKFLDQGLYVQLLMGRVEGEWIDLTNAELMSEFKRTWQLVAEHYQDWSDRLSFELCNEPGKNYWALNKLQKETVALIRQTNPTRLILWPVGDGSQPWVLTQAANPPKFDWVSLPAGDTNIAIVVHTYAPADFTHQGASWGYDANGHVRDYHVDLTDASRSILREDLIFIGEYAKAHPDIPLVLNEFSVNHGVSTPADAHEWLSTVREYCEANNVTWQHFIYTDFNSSDGMGARSSPTGAWRENVIDALFPKGWDDVPGVYGRLDLGAFAKKMRISFPGYTGNEPLSDFPVLVKLSTAIPGFSYGDFLKSNGGDLRFVDSGGNLIPHEIDTWDTSGVSTVWVKVPELSASTRIYACYGCANPPAVTAMDVWDDGYVGVWHLGESALPLRESTRRGPSFTARCGEDISFASAGTVGSSIGFGASYSNGVIAVDHDNLDGFEKFTVEAWTKQSAHKANAGILSKRRGSNRSVSYYMFDTGSKTRFCVSDNGTNVVVSSDLAAPAANGVWQYQAYSLDTTTASENVRGYLNGLPSGTASKSAGRVNADVGFLTLGNLQPSAKNNNFEGQIDEVRISKCVRSADWIKATHDTIANAAFATYAVEGVTPPGPGPQPVEYGPLAVSDYAKSMSVTFAGAPSDATLTNFPVLVKLSTAISGFSYADFNRPNGGDLRFADANGNLLAHEIDTWNESGVSTVWVKVPQLAKDTAITAHYGYTGSGDPVDVDPKDVWDSNYVGVWHLGESALPMAESTGVSTPFASKTGTASYGAAGAVGGSVDFKAAKGTESFLTAADDDDLDGFNDFTVEMWTCQDSFYNANEAYAGTIVKRNARADNESWFTYQDKATRKPGIAYGNDAAASDRTLALANTLPAAGAWTHQAFVRTVGTSKVVAFMDGAENGTTEKSSGSVFAGSAPLMLGGGGGQKSFPGRIDEVRISKTARSAAWVKATHDTIANASFATYTLRGAPSSGYAAWVAEKGITGAAAAFDKKTNGIANGIRYAFDIDPAVATVGEPILKVVRDANGNPSVQSRDLATGRDDVTFGILATPDLTDWSNAKLISMEKFAGDGLWKPTASKTSGYVYPAKMFFRYKVEAK